MRLSFSALAEFFKARRSFAGPNVVLEAELYGSIPSFSASSSMATSSAKNPWVAPIRASRREVRVHRFSMETQVLRLVVNFNIGHPVGKDGSFPLIGRKKG